MVWTRLIMPNGRSIVLERQPGADAQGFAGLEDEVDQHRGRLFTAGALSTLLGVGSELGATNKDNSIVAALRRSSTDSLIDFSLAMVCAKQPHNIWLAVSPAD